MIGYRCKCGSVIVSSSMGVRDCEGCDKCNTTLAFHPDYHKPREPHEWKDRYNQNTGKPYKVCNKCGEVDRQSYEQSKLKC